MTLQDAALLGMVSFLFVITPGPGIFALIARALSRGTLAGARLSLGLLAGDIVYLSLAIAGLAVLAVRFHALFVGVELAGALYLVWLGLRAWRTPAVALDTRAETRPAGWADVLAGLFTALGNPKMVLFYVGLLPAFISLHPMGSARYALVVIIVGGARLLGCLVYVLLCTRVRRLFVSAAAVRRLNRISGAVLMGAGVLIAGQHLSRH